MKTQASSLSRRRIVSRLTIPLSVAACLLSLLLVGCSSDGTSQSGDFNATLEVWDAFSAHYGEVAFGCEYLPVAEGQIEVGEGRIDIQVSDYPAKLFVRVDNPLALKPERYYVAPDRVYVSGEYEGKSLYVAWR